MLYAKHPNHREEAYDKALKMAEECSKNMQILILRSQISKQMKAKLELDLQNNVGKK